MAVTHHRINQLYSIVLGDVVRSSNHDANGLSIQLL